MEIFNIFSRWYFYYIIIFTYKLDGFLRLIVAIGGALMCMAVGAVIVACFMAICCPSELPCNTDDPENPDNCKL
jgi:hypothetical protein